MKFDETELIEFFGVLPTEQNPEEQEFFGTTIFDYFQESIHLSISYSIHYKDFTLILKANELEKPLLEIHFKYVNEIKVTRDKPTSTPVLLIKARVNDEDTCLEEATRAIEITLQPSINVKLQD